jgi:uncharacterized protein
MSLLRIFGLGKHRADEEALRERVTTLQRAFDHCKRLAKRSTEVRLEVMGVIAVVFLALGFALGVYREPILQTARDLAAKLGISRAAPTVDAANAAFHKGDFATALKLARPLAEAGDARALSILGLLHYYGGRGVMPDYQEAAKWFRRAADQGDVAAPLYLGIMFAGGQGVPQDHAEAAKWFRRAADQGDAAAPLYLGIMFAGGQGVPQDHAEAAKWFRRAADHGNAEAMYNLGLAYATGLGVSLDNVSAHMWLNLAAAHFPAFDARSRSDAIYARDDVAGKMTPEQVAEAERLAREWQPQ